MRMHSEVEIDIIFSNQVLDLTDNYIDIAIRTGPLPDSNLIARRIAYRRLTVVCAPEYKLEHGLPTTPEDLNLHRCLVGASNQWSFNYEGHDRYVKVYGNWHSNNGKSLRLAALSGLGLTQLP